MESYDVLESYNIEDDIGENFDSEINGVEELELHADYEMEDEGLVQVPNMDFLNNVDYSLNSPLVLDELADFLNYAKDGYLSTRWNQKDFELRREVLMKYISFKDVNEIKSFHSWFGTYNSREVIDVKDFDLLLRKTQQDTNETIEVPHAFFRTWTGTNHPHVDKSNVPHFVRSWGALFFECHKLVLILNHANQEELENLRRSIGFEIINTSKGIGVKMETKSFGTVIMIKGFVLLKRYGQLIDRNCLLMMKDTYAARFQALFCMMNRYDEKFKDYELEKLQNVYKTGDFLLAQMSSEAFDYIKFVEPICNLRFTQLARKHRPLIPEIGEFKKHVEGGVSDSLKDTRYLMDIYKIIMEEDSEDMVLTYYGIFRHWGHPFIEYLTGLEKLYLQVSMKKEIDLSYAEDLASDLAFMVLQSQFKEHKTWYVDKSKLSPHHKLYNNVEKCTWPTPNVIQDFGNNWHKLPLTKCFEIPDVTDPSLLYSDKSHSLDLDAIINHLRNYPGRSIPTKKVLRTLMERTATNWPEFLERIDKFGLPKNSLVIGLKEKEREVKRFGRFFSLMSWDLREYFVFTEYLIKTYFVPLFYGLTMADDLTTVVKKMLDNTNGQGLNDYSQITIANHIDYEKWNNHQRKESNGPVFKVMGQFFGLPNLFYRTHEFFEKSFIYYNNRTDLMKVVNGEIQNSTSQRVCWQGQKGGLEGLRQKGWSILNLLVIRREGASRNTRIRTLAQGDNQVICTQYKLQKCRTDEELSLHIDEILVNNKNIMSAIERGTKSIGLIINKDETMQSADYLNYGKVPVFRSNIRISEVKRYARVTCTSNDQIPTMSAILSTVTSNALTVSHFSESPVNPIYHMNFLGNFARNLMEFHNPAIRNKVRRAVREPDLLNHRNYKIATLYLDPSLGGSSGTSLTRFLIRMFPDPITEGLTFWKMVYKGTKDPDLRRLCAHFGSPKLGSVDAAQFSKLLEDPPSLNIPRGISAETMLKNEVKKNLLDNSSKIKNEIISSATRYSKSEEPRLINFLRSIKPLFPRFLSEYKSATYLGLTDSLVGLFQNSRTIRNLFSKNLKKELDHIVVKSESLSLQALLRYGKDNTPFSMWNCSSTHADRLRRLSWGEDLVGATVPHPAEMLSVVNRHCGHCNICIDEYPSEMYISVYLPEGLADYKNSRGRYPPYLGSKTSESTSILQPWEKETKIPLLRRASKLRNAIGWFVKRDGRLSESIYQNLESLTGETWSGAIKGFERTGSAIHRFSCTRQSSGGFTAQSPVKLTRMMSTTNTLADLKDVNYDFMFQSCLIYSQITIGEIHDNDPEQGMYHFHIGCKDCLRPIDEVKLDTHLRYEHPFVSNTIKSWKPDCTEWSIKIPILEIPEGNWDLESDGQKSYHIGRIEGFLFGDLLLSGSHHVDDSSLFPLALQKRVNPEYYTNGVLDGLMRASSISVIYRRSITELNKPRATLLGTALYLIDRIGANPNLVNIWRFETFLNLFSSVQHKIPSSYPLNNNDLGLLGRNYMKKVFLKLSKHWDSFQIENKKIWIFSDVNHLSIITLLSISSRLIKIFYKGQLKPDDRSQLRELKNFISNIKGSNFDSLEEYEAFAVDVYSLPRELRHASKDITVFDEDVYRKSKLSDYETTLINTENALTFWGIELSVPIESMMIDFISTSREEQYCDEKIDIPKIQDPLISGLRLFQFATGAHVKIQSILHHMEIAFTDAIVGGDGSGGICSLLLRKNTSTRLIFNSLLLLDGVNLKGSNPSPPSAIMAIPGLSKRCVNFLTAWKNPNDLSRSNTWNYFIVVKEHYNLMVDLMIFDMQVQDVVSSNRILDELNKNIGRLLQTGGTIIFKTYLDTLINKPFNVLTVLGRSFRKVDICWTEASSSHTSEVYAVLQGYNSNIFNHVYPDIKYIRSRITNFPVFKPRTSEFKRAQRLKYYDFFQGVPHNYTSDIEVDLGILLTSMGVETGLAYSLSRETLCKQFSTNASWPFALFILTSNAIVNITRGSSYRPTPPSDDQVLSLGSWIVGFYMWYSHVTSQFEVKANIQSLIDKTFPFNWGCYVQDGRYFANWSLYYHLDLSKYIHLDHKMATIGQVIRILTRIFLKDLVKPDRKDVENALIRYNRNLTLQRVRGSSSLLKEIESVPFNFKDPRRGFANFSMNMEGEALAWTS